MILFPAASVLLEIGCWESPLKPTCCGVQAPSVDYMTGSKLAGKVLRQGIRVYLESHQTEKMAD